jgi:hypothetical protein
MDAKKIGVIVLCVVAIALLVFSLKNSFFNGPAPAGVEKGLAIKRANEEAARRNRERGGGGESGSPVGPGAMRPAPGAPGTHSPAPGGQ